jgi:hypothetical protein
MHAPNAPAGLLLPFNNPIEIFPAQPDGTIQFDASYKAVCRELTAESMTVLQAESAAPPCLVVGVHCEGRIFFLPGRRLDLREVGPGVFELQAHFTTKFDPQGQPPRIEFIPEEEVADWVKGLQDRRKPAEEKRKHERTAYNEPIAMSPAPPGGPVYALNISAGGIALLTTFPLGMGDIRTLGLPQPDGTTKRVKVCVVRCVQLLPRFYEIGGQFVGG